MSQAAIDAAEMAAFIDKAKIQEVLVRYSRAVDRADIDLLRTCYHDDAVEDHGGVYKGSATAYVEMLAPVLPNAGRLSHAVSNVYVELNDDVAIAESYITTFSRMKKAGEKFDTLTLARAVDRFEKRQGEWRIAERQISWEWNMEIPNNESWGRGIICPDPSQLVRGGKKPADILYQMRAAAGLAD
ncbi:MAG: hypothetical protein Tsb0016_19680 [Sphingomonadales bacterium]